MVSKLGKLIQDAVREEIKSSLIASPRFSDYRVQDFLETGAFESFDTELNELLRAEIKSKSSQGNKEIEGVKKDVAKVSGDISNIQSSISDPRGAIFDQVNKVIENFPVAKLALTLLPLVGVALATPAVINKIIDFLVMPGGPFMRQLTIILEDQEEQFLTRLQQKRRQTGQDQVVISLFEGFGNEQGRFTTNTLNQVKATGTSAIGLNEIEIGMR
jgi:hypothetical protein